MSVEPLLAKGHGSRIVTLHDHLHDTGRAAALIFQPESRILSSWLRFFRLSPDDGPTFLNHLVVAGLLHDLGKANAEFQAAMHYQQQEVQSLRHEHLSALLLFIPEVRAWLERGALDIDILAAAVLSHHCKADNQGDWKWGQSRRLPQMKVYFEHPEVQEILLKIQARASLAPPPALPTEPWSEDRSPWREALTAGMNAAIRFNPKLLSTRAPTRYRLHLAVKAGLIAADTVASGLVREGHDFAQWLGDSLHRPALLPQQLQQDILTPRAKAIERVTGQPFSLHIFQRDAASLGDRGLLLAACGTGKTLAAWRWAQEQLGRMPAGRVIFLYPTRGTATEGFRDYVGWAPEGTAELLHGSAIYELQGMLQNPPESLRGKALIDEQNARLFALRLWDKRYFSATVDQFLSFLEHHYQGLCLLPILADSVLILDEIHSYDEPMFRRLMAFLEHFHVPVLCMTATLPPDRQAQLEKVGLQVYPSDTQRVVMQDLQYQEQRPRYVHTSLRDADVAMDVALSAYQQGKRVLWVHNTVNRCQQAALAIASQLGFVPLVYHSRFTLGDRRDKHTRTIQAFQQKNQPALALTTQVCEMSLDLDADVLITEAAPISSLVQRFGRANRHPDRHPPTHRGQLYSYEPASHLPYEKEELDAAQRFLNDLPAESSQQDLTTLLKKHTPRERAVDPWSGFLGRGYFAISAGFRDDDTYSRSCVLQSDLLNVKQMLQKNAKIDAFILPAPHRQSRDEPSLPPYLGVVDDADYSHELGLLQPSGASR